MEIIIFKATSDSLPIYCKDRVSAATTGEVKEYISDGACYQKTYDSLTEALDLGKNIYKITSEQSSLGYEIAVHGEYVIWAGNHCLGVTSTLGEALSRLSNIIDISVTSCVRIEL